ncbi:MAG: pyridoxamine 5'-phosphate oxidase family protein [Spirochaetes bacterium]|nr:pyridoxamine 5'-phosphate oxidase family protein [Spirochaetota bacterium]
MRKKEKQMTDPAEIDAVLLNNKICRIALSDNNKPYLIPMSYGYDKKSIYLHCAKEGYKIDIINKNNQVCFEVTDSIEITQGNKACNFSTKYRSVIGFGSIHLVNDQQKKIKALHILMKQYVGEQDWQFLPASVNNVQILEIQIESITGKKSGY